MSQMKSPHLVDSEAQGEGPCLRLNRQKAVTKFHALNCQLINLYLNGTSLYLIFNWSVGEESLLFSERVYLFVYQTHTMFYLLGTILF